MMTKKPKRQSSKKGKSLPRIVMPKDSRRKERIEYFTCFCSCCGHSWTVSTVEYMKFKPDTCPECPSQYYEADNPHFVESLETRLRQQDLPLEI